MFENLLDNLKGLGKKDNTEISKEKAIKILKANPDAFERFEEIYKVASLVEEEQSDNLFDKGKSFFDRKESIKIADNPIDYEYINSIIDRIVDELLLYPITEKDDYKNGKIKLVTREELEVIPKELRPQLTGTMVMKDIDKPSYPVVLFYYDKYLKSDNPNMKKEMMLNFLMGLDTLDLDPITYAILGENSNTFGKWFPQLEKAVEKNSFFKIPKTKFIKVPLPLLQLTRLDYERINETTKKIINKYCMKAFELDVNKDYFVKTGTFSYKFDFRNCKVTKGKEVTELGEYLLFIHNFALNMSSYLSKPTIVGASTTNEWVVREYVEDLENNPTIYKGMPLHTEYRVFIDCDNKEIIGAAPYWDVKLLTERFTRGHDKDTADKKHDYISVQVHKEVLEERYNKNIEKVKEKVNELLKDLDLKGQWSLDIMQNKDDFYIIDMALANQSALYDCVPLEKRKNNDVDWMPEIKSTTNYLKP